MLFKIDPQPTTTYVTVIFEHFITFTELVHHENSVHQSETNSEVLL